MGLSFLSFFYVSSFDLLPDPYAIWGGMNEEIQELNACSISLQMLWKELKKKKGFLSCLSHSPGHMKVKATLVALLMTVLF